MKQLNLLMPDVRTGYFKSTDRKKELYKFVHVNNQVDLKTLKQDIRIGAKQFMELLALQDKKESQYIVIDCDSEEEGLTAVCYLEGIHSNLFCENIEDGDCDTESDNWYLEPCNVPVISIDELRTAGNLSSEAFPFAMTNYHMRGDFGEQQHEPYWYECTDEAICITCSTFDTFAPTEFDRKLLKRFNFNRKVYILNVVERLHYDFEDTDWNDDLVEKYDVNMCRFLLEYTANHVSICKADEQEDKWYRLLFTQYLGKYHLQKEKSFPEAKIVQMLSKIDQAYPSATMDKVFRYIMHTEEGCTILRRDHFKQIGIAAQSEKKADKGMNEQMDSLVGMESVKSQVEDIIQMLRYVKYRKEMGLGDVKYHNVFLLIGAPGTAKTTIAKILGQRLRKEKILLGSQFASYSGAELKGQYVGQTAPRIHDIFEENDIILIDEAYSLTASDGRGIDTFSQEALAQLAIELENHGTDRLIFFAGYGGEDVSSNNNKMKEFLDANPGIKSRVNGTIYFPSYTENEMVSIVHGIANQMKLTFEKNEIIDDIIRNYFRQRVNDENFGNGREARSFIENCQVQLARRVMSLPAEKRSKKMLLMITVGDVEKTINQLRKSNKSQEGIKRSIGFC